MLVLAWAETIGAAGAVAVFISLIFRQRAVTAAVAFVGIVVVMAAVNMSVVRLVRYRANAVCKRHRAALESRGVAISAHLERWEFACMRVELWVELECISRGRPAHVMPLHTRV
jgi:hypothetical protein